MLIHVCWISHVSIIPSIAFLIMNVIVCTYTYVTYIQLPNMLRIIRAFSPSTKNTEIARHDINSS